MKVTVQEIDEAAVRLAPVIHNTPLVLSKRLSAKYNAQIYLKREDLQEVRSFKIRGAFNKMSSLTEEERKRGVVCASAGNHAQGVAYSCSHLKIKGTIFMPSITPTQKIDRVKHFGGKFIEIKLIDTTYDDAAKASYTYCKEKNAIYVHPFNDPITVAGQGTVGKEIFEGLDGEIDYVIGAIGGGGMISGVATYLKDKNPSIKIIGAEPAGAPAMFESIKAGKLVTLESFETFVDGAAVGRVGDMTFEICQKTLEQVMLVPEGKVCTTMIDLYQNEGIIAEPAGALSIAALDDIADTIVGKTVVCILSGGNNDILRYPEIMERSLVYQGRKHYFIIEFSQKPGQLRKFVDKALGPYDDIVRFEYIKKTNKDRGAALVGIELQDKKDLEPLKQRLKDVQINFRVLSSEELLYDYII